MKVKYPTTVSEARIFFGLPADGSATLSISAAGFAAHRWKKSQSYDAAKHGAFPLIEIAGRRRVPIVPLAIQVLTGSAEAAQASDQDALEDEARCREDGEDEEADAETMEAA